ncbi:MAG: HigA family addiction module antidote protein [Betaproteobacteria bacterium]|nr:HigA family addiction module antidote protein [Betaproteobacteria bacterium]
MQMKNPPHPGRIVRQECLLPFNLSVADAAKGLGVSRQTLNQLLIGKSALTPEMAVRLSKAIGNEPDFWLRLQRQYDLALALKDADKIKVKKFTPKVLVTEF